MELLDIVDEYGEPTGRTKERNKVHADGDLHRTSHVWIFREKPNGRRDVLLQKRSSTKDSFPGCYDISSAGHIPARDGYLESALRELEEELGIIAKEEELILKMVRRISNYNIFYGKEFIDNQVTQVYSLKRNDLEIASLILQKDEIESVIWMDYEECLEAVKYNRIHHCIFYDELKAVGE